MVSTEENKDHLSQKSTLHYDIVISFVRIYNFLSKSNCHSENYENPEEISGTTLENCLNLHRNYMSS